MVKTSSLKADDSNSTIAASVDAGEADERHSIENENDSDPTAPEGAEVGAPVVAAVAIALAPPQDEIARRTEALLRNRSTVYRDMPEIFDLFVVPRQDEPVWRGGYTAKIDRELPVEGAQEATTELCLTLFASEDKPRRARNVFDTKYLMAVVCQRAAALDALIALAARGEFVPAPLPALPRAKDHPFLPTKTCIVVPDHLQNKTKQPILLEVLQVTEQYLLCHPLCPLVYCGDASYLRVMRLNRNVAVDVLSGCIGFHQERAAAGDHVWALRLGLCPGTVKEVAGGKKWKEDMVRKYESHEYKFSVQHLGTPETAFQVSRNAGMYHFRTGHFRTRRFLMPAVVVEHFNLTSFSVLK